tara:strand:+ start:181 stop:342 length:162 start_codon:yes stop_codon:yes gene_type:complete
MVDRDITFFRAHFQANCSLEDAEEKQEIYFTPAPDFIFMVRLIWIELSFNPGG